MPTHPRDSKGKHYIQLITCPSLWMTLLLVFAFSKLPVQGAEPSPDTEPMKEISSANAIELLEHFSNRAVNSEPSLNQGSETLEPSESLVSLLEALHPKPESVQVSRRFQSIFLEGPSRPSRVLGVGKEQVVFEAPLAVNPRVEGHMRFFHTAIRDRFEQWLIRLGRYKRQVEQIFAEFDLPTDLIFLSLVESGFNPHAYSRARATGPWQFMTGTAKNYGLRVDQYIDERRDPIKSTVAAAQYLRDLYDMFGTWPLAMAAYNAGEGRVMRALQKSRATSYWEIAQTKHLKRETKDYVPRFLAAMTIAKNPDQYGFAEMDLEPHAFEEVVVDRSLHLREIAAAAGLRFEDLSHFNPELRRSLTPPGERYHLKVPVGSKTSIESVLDRVKTWKGPLPSAKGDRPSGKWYRVRVGDTLQTIAKRFQISIPELRAKNRLSAHSILRPGQRLRVSS
jgi:membrane-bound lytic murein transglycosylase D